MKGSLQPEDTTLQLERWDRAGVDPVAAYPPSFHSATRNGRRGRKSPAQLFPILLVALIAVTVSVGGPEASWTMHRQAAVGGLTPFGIWGFESGGCYAPVSLPTPLQLPVLGNAA